MNLDILIKKVTRHQGDELLPKTQTFIERRSQKKRKKKPFSERIPKGNALTITQGANPVKYLFIYPYNLKFAQPQYLTYTKPWTCLKEYLE